MNRFLILIIILLIASITSCGDNTDPVNPEPEPTLEEIVIQNCHIVKKAADSFAAENDGEYPSGLADTSLAGNTFQDLLPGGELLLNPYTGLKTEPRYGCNKQLGEITYYAPVAGGRVLGYLIFAVDEDVEYLCALYSYSEEFFEEEMGVIARCYRMQVAAQEFADNNGGIFPLDVDTDEDLSGNTIEWYLGYSHLDIVQENIFTGLRTNPVNGIADVPGEIGYLPVMANNIPTGYIITGYGAHQLIKAISIIPAIDN